MKTVRNHQVKIFKCMRCDKIIEENELEYKIDKIYTTSKSNIDGTHYCNFRKGLIGYVKLIGHNENLTIRKHQKE